MSLTDEVDKISSPGRHTAAAGGVSAEIDVIDADRIGVVIERVRARGRRGDVVERAAAFAERLRPGGQPLTPIEVDATLGGATLRSPPDDRRRYYEAGVTEDAIELTRQQVGSDGSRQPIDFALTREQLGDMIGGIADVMEPTEG